MFRIRYLNEEHRKGFDNYKVSSLAHFTVQFGTFVLVEVGLGIHTKIEIILFSTSISHDFFFIEDHKAIDACQIH